MEMKLCFQCQRLLMSSVTVTEFIYHTYLKIYVEMRLIIIVCLQTKLKNPVGHQSAAFDVPAINEFS